MKYSAVAAVIAGVLVASSTALHLQQPRGQPKVVSFDLHRKQGKRPLRRRGTVELAMDNSDVKISLILRRTIC